MCVDLSQSITARQTQKMNKALRIRYCRTAANLIPLTFMNLGQLGLTFSLPLNSCGELRQCVQNELFELSWTEILIVSELCWLCIAVFVCYFLNESSVKPENLFASQNMKLGNIII